MLDDFLNYLKVSVVLKYKLKVFYRLFLLLKIFLYHYIPTRLLQKIKYNYQLKTYNNLFKTKSLHLLNKHL